MGGQPGTNGHFGACVALGSVVTEDNERLPKQQTQAQQDRRPICPACAAVPRLINAFLDPARGKSVRLFECQCGERIWDD
jgi:formate dehydrogenase maturation protein FdhE